MTQKMGVLWSSLEWSSTRRLKLNHRRLIVVKKIAEGGYATVQLVKDDHNTEYALKIMRLQLPEQIQAFQTEVDNHKLVKHPHVASVIDWVVRKSSKRADDEEKEGWLLLPYYKNGSLQDLIDKGDHNLKQLLVGVIGACRGLVALHSLATPHAFRDIKPGNIVLDKDGYGVLIDLGSVVPARIKITDRKQALAIQELCAQTVTAPFRPPELFDVSSDAELNELSDVWSLGCTLYAALYGQSPFDGSATASISGRFTFPQHPSYPDRVKQIIGKMLKVDPTQRPSTQETLTELQEIADTVS